jgi:II/X family phage/plasmid replication protein
MIDTIRFKINLSDLQYKNIVKYCVDTLKVDNLLKKEIFHISKKDLSVGSWNRKISLYLPEVNVCFLEFSVPKFKNGHNVWLISYKEFLGVITKLNNILKEYFGSFPSFKKWIITRIDLCYAWKLETEERAERILDVLQNFEFSKKKKSVYDTSVMYVGKTFSLKFYLKYPEYFKHDFKYIRDNGFLDLAYNTLERSRGIIRFEVTLRSQYLRYHFEERNVMIKHMTEDRLWDIMVSLFTKYMMGFPLKYSSRKQIKEELQSYYGVKKGGRLWIFYVYLISEGKENLKEIYAQSTIWQYLRELRDIGIPLSYQDIKFKDFNLSIPSSNVVNKI